MSPESIKEGPLARALHEQAMQVTQIEAPTHVFRSHIFDALRAGDLDHIDPQQMQATISAHMGPFIQYTRDTMPPDLVARYMRAALPDAIKEIPPSLHLLLPAWVDTPRVVFRDDADRKNRGNFTQSEMVDYVHWIEKRPDVTLGIYYAQHLMSQYLNELQRRLLLVSPNAWIDLEEFRPHWEKSVNFRLFFGKGIHHCGGWRDDPKIDRDTVRRMFAFLDTLDLFAFRAKPVPSAPPSVRPIVFACPAEECLRKVLVDRDMLAEVIDCTVKSHGTYSPLSQTIVKQAQQLQQLVPQGLAAYDANYEPAARLK